MKRFLKHDHYQLSDLEKEQSWHAVRRELKRGKRPSIFRTVNLRPALVTTVAMVALVALGVWWIDTDQPQKIQTGYPSLLAEGPAEEIQQDPRPAWPGGRPGGR